MINKHKVEDSLQRRKSRKDRWETQGLSFLPNFIQIEVPTFKNLTFMTFLTQIDSPMSIPVTQGSFLPNFIQIEALLKIWPLTLNYGLKYATYLPTHLLTETPPYNQPTKVVQ